ncbi:unnamed protein product [Moneuplotes crassus]|uniref:Uncharacterized protein n=1 Tax=Euplotes crassus TaxID=5936 RepID=A0AAD1Y7E4_EUPCR|nr:unnamed protein product [Moneuplotes crassus]
MFRSHCQSLKRSIEDYEHKFEVAQQVRLESKQNLQLVNKQRMELLNENRYKSSLNRRRNEIKEVLKEAIRVNILAKKRTQEAREKHKLALKKEREKKIRLKIAEQQKDYHRLKDEAKKKRLQKLLRTDTNDIEELEKMLQDTKNMQYDKMIENQQLFEKNAPSVSLTPKLGFNKGNKQITTDVSFDKDGILRYPYNADLKILNNGLGEEYNDRHQQNLNYLYGTKAFDAIQKLSKEQIKEYLPLTTLDVDEENDPEWLRDYKRFLKTNKINMDTKITTLKEDYDLTKDLEESKNSKWYSKQKYRLVRQLRKHQESKSNNSDKKELKLPPSKPPVQIRNVRDSIGPLKTENNKENSNYFDMEPPKIMKTIDTAVETDPDILNLLVEMKNDQVSNTNQVVSRPRARSKLNEVPNTYNNNYRSPNIQEEDEDGLTQVSLKGSKKSVATEKYKSNSFERVSRNKKNKFFNKLNYYGNAGLNYRNDLSLPKSSTRYGNNISKPKENSKLREKIRVNDRLHILDRMSSSMHTDDNKSTKDFSDAQSIKYKKMPRLYNPYEITTGTRQQKMVNISMGPKITTKLMSDNKKRSRMYEDQSIFNLNRSSHEVSDGEMSDDFKQYNLDYSSPNISPLSVQDCVKQNKQRVKADISKKLKKINKKLDSKFKLSLIDIEQLQTNCNLKLGDWDREINEKLLVRIMKEERRKEYWKRRIKVSNPAQNKSQMH